MFIGCAAQYGGVGYCSLDSPKIDYSSMVVKIKKLNKNASNETFNIVGEVRDSLLEKDSQLAGVNLLIKGKNIGTMADIEGAFQLNGLNMDDTISVSYMGYKAKEILVKDVVENRKKIF